MILNFEAFEIEKEGETYYFPPGFMQKTSSGHLLVMDECNLPYKHPYVFPNGYLDTSDANELHNYLRCNVAVVPIRPFYSFLNNE